ncbi:two-component sensor histidine kinase [Chroococcidiopsis sp. CCALA 051]|uniref:sensor histidine kinase n=1 Tax=Chroococcidiopsis sp. CCALA 051 TaxID=869949 RepID=UPI000D0D0179|nr:ATP-binding protein [Chroococcidiopsis sp. CCALA 051]PSM48834.1 two-component sensor histidine kinase [Chroococcidiopsis sp. CCALA 051]
MVSLKWIDRIPLRVKLTVWYVLLLGLTLSGLTGYLYFRLERKLISKVDTALQIVASQFLGYLADEDDSLAFQNKPIQRNASRRLRQVGFAIRLITPDGKVVDGFGRYRELPAKVPTEKGFATRSRNEVEWRTIDQPVVRNGQIVGWLQVAQSLETLEEISEELPMEVLFSLPLVLLLAASGGLFLSNRALRPIKKINRTAQAIAATDDLNRRVNYWGAADEVGQLATTFDQMLDRLQAAFEREQQFTANAAHELRTPLAVIKGRIGVTRTRLRTVAEYDKTLQDLEQEVDRLIRLSNGLLLLARIDRGQFPFNLLSVDLSSLLEVIVEQIQPLAEQQQIAIANHLPAELQVQGDPDCLTNLFLNLLDNAVKYTPAGGIIRLWVKERDSEEKMVEVAVSNTGASIPPEHLPHLFERFYRAESAHGSKNGAGLGLAIASEIVRLHGGAIVVESNPGQETTFTVNLPASDK